ncbi:MAG: transketolase C-terminal domain-containing protein [Spirochaetia bacterium]|jgi:transketolase
MDCQKNLREAWGQALLALARRNPKIVALEADLGKSTRSILLQEAFPERYFQMGIAEQNMASTAAGLALAGKIPFIHSFAVFASGRTYDQLRNSICIPKLPVRICGSSAGLSDFGDGKTHQALEDVAIMRALPNMTVLCPADGIECAGMVAALETWPGPAYVRVNRNELPFVTPTDRPYRIGPATVLRRGTDAVIFACGVMVSQGLEAAERLAQSGISTGVVNVSTIKPIDRQTIVEHARGVRAIVTAEEHSVVGGLGSAVLEALRLERHAPLDFVGVQDCFGLSAADYEGLLAYFGLTASAIERAVRTLLKA